MVLDVFDVKPAVFTEVRSIHIMPAWYGSFYSYFLVVEKPPSTI